MSPLDFDDEHPPIKLNSSPGEGEILSTPLFGFSNLNGKDQSVLRYVGQVQFLHFLVKLYLELAKLGKRGDLCSWGISEGAWLGSSCLLAVLIRILILLT
mmetsp:Transcript_10107/g.15436  ORF Transcript_10107/g.15436 Transcript_10107/m.15436 type:complete len:100 (+) Transcript_10107:1139-1438(+)